VSTKSKRRRAVAAAVGIVGAITLFAGSAEAYSYTQGSCPAGNECLTTTNFSSTDSTSTGSTMVGWNIAASDNGYFNLFNFNYQGGSTTSNNSHDSRNRNSSTGRTACWYSGANISGSSSSDPYSSSVYWRDLGIGANNAESFDLVAAGTSC
jgi:hypothetical protein